MDDCNDINEVLNVFKESVPSVTKYGYENKKETFNTHKSININSSLIKGYVSTFVDKDYLSCTYLYDETTIASIAHEEFSDEGIYNKISKVTEQENKLLFDLYYFILS